MTINYKPITIRCEIYGKECKGLIGLSSHISQSNNHQSYKLYIKKYPIDRYIFEQMKELFFKNIKKNSKECWLWTGTIGQDDYGEIYSFTKRIPLHRFSYELFKGKIPNNLCVCHKCDVPNCVNPEHLWLGTSTDNTKDSVIKGRRKYLIGNTNPTKRPQIRKKISESLKGKARPSMIGNKNNKRMFGDENPMRNPEIAKKCATSRKKGRKDNE